MGDDNWVGTRGEFLALAKLMRAPPGWAFPCFSPHLLGEKAEGIDVLVRLAGVTGAVPCFFA